LRFDEVGWGSGHVFRVERRQGSVWYAKYRLPDGRQVKRKIGPAWSGRRRPRVGYFTRRGAEEWLRETLDDARERAHAGARRTDATFAEAAREWLRYVEHDRACKPSTLRSYRSTLEAHLLPAFGAMRVHEITPGHIERWRAGLTGSPRTKNKLLTELHGVFRRAQKVYGLERNPAAEVEKLRQRRRLDLDVFTPEEVRALCRRRGDRTGRGDLSHRRLHRAAPRRADRAALARRRLPRLPHPGLRVLRRRTAHRAQEGKVRSVPLASEVAAVLTQLGQRERWTGDDDLVFPGELGGHLGGSALRRRYLEALERAGLRRLRFHDLRHTFGTAMIAKADILRVMEWMGHADVQTTRGHLHYRPRPDYARLADEAFSTDAVAAHVLSLEQASIA
jgi:integrase